MQTQPMSAIRQWIDQVSKDNDVQLVILEPKALDSAIIGITDDHEHLIYDYGKLVTAMTSDLGSCDDAVEWIDFNTLRSLSYMGKYRPYIMYRPQV